MRASLFLLPAALLCSLPSIARADDAPQAELQEGAVVKPAQVLTDPNTGVRQVVVPAGCSSTVQASGQIVVLCPAPAPTSSEREAPPKYETSEEREAPSGRKWYGWQTLMVDGINHGLTSVLLLSAAGANNSEMAGTIGMVSLGTYAFGGPIVHWANGQVGKGFASLGIRVGAPVVLGATGAMLGGGDTDATVTLAVLGIMAGVGTAIALDAAALAYKPDELRRSARATPKLQWTPNAGYDSKRQTVTVGVGGTF